MITSGLRHVPAFVAVIGFTVADGKIAEIDAVADPERIRRIAAAVLDG